MGWAPLHPGLTGGPDEQRIPGPTLILNLDSVYEARANSSKMSSALVTYVNLDFKFSVGLLRDLFTFTRWSLSERWTCGSWYPQRDSDGSTEVLIVNEHRFLSQPSITFP